MLNSMLEKQIADRETEKTMLRNTVSEADQKIFELTSKNERLEAQLALEKKNKED